MGGAQNENPGALMTQPGLEDRYATAADLSEIAQTTLERPAFRLRWVYGLTEANALAALVWGARQ